MENESTLQSDEVIVDTEVLEAREFVPMPKPLPQSGDSGRSDRQSEVGHTAESFRARLFGSLTFSGLLQGIRPKE